jgi:protein O-GlcNAc transferase
LNNFFVVVQGWTKGRRPRLFALGIAPIQMLHAWGFVGTSGAPYMQYFITDSVVTPVSHKALFTESLLRLPNCYVPVSHSLVYPSAALARIDRLALRTLLSLPQNATILANFQIVSKISAAALESWCRILSKAPHAVLILLRPSKVDVENRLRTRCGKVVDVANVDSAALLRVYKNQLIAINMGQCVVA